MTGKAPVHPSVERAELDTPAPLSRSPLWLLHDEYFRRSGSQAWTSGDVPHLLTNSPMVARAYAQVIEAVLEDCVAGRFGPIDPGEPVYVLELGAGLGRLGYNVLHALEAPVPPGPPVVYVLSDAFESNLAFWRQHPRLAPLFESGRLDLARYDVGAGGPLELERSGTVLVPGALANPLVVVANYLFDVLRQDLFRLEDGRLLEELVSIVPPNDDLEIGSSDFFRRLVLRVSAEPVPGDRYADRELQAVLEEVAAERAGDGPSRFLFPTQALGGLRHLLDLADDRLVVLLGERPGEAGQPGREVPAVGAGSFGGPDTAAAVSGGTETGGGEAAEAAAGEAAAAEAAAGDGDGAATGDGAGETSAGPNLPPGSFRPGHLIAMGVHGGSISLPVDLDILSRVVTRRGGELILPEASPAGLLVGACIAGDGGAARASRRRFTQVVDEGGPEDLFLSIRAMLERGTEDLPLAMALALLRVGGYDAYLFRQVHERLAELLPGADAAGIDEAVRVMRETWVRFYPIDDRTDLAFGIAALLAPAGRLVEALEFLGYSHEHRPTALACYNAALCHALLGDEPAARAALAESLERDPKLAVALELQRKMDAADEVMRERAGGEAGGVGGEGAEDAGWD